MQYHQLKKGTVLYCTIFQVEVYSLYLLQLYMDHDIQIFELQKKTTQKTKQKNETKNSRMPRHRAYER